MTVSLKKWGNSLALRIPKDIVKTLDIEDESKLELFVENGVLMVKPQHNDLLESLVSRIDVENVHTEIETGEGLGNEEW